LRLIFLVSFNEELKDNPIPVPIILIKLVSFNEELKEAKALCGDTHKDALYPLMRN